MKAALNLLIVFLATAVRAFAQNASPIEWGPVTSNCQMSIGCEANLREVKTNEPLKLLVQIRTVSTNDSFFFPLQLRSLLGSGFSLVVTSPSGRDVSPKPPQITMGSVQLARVLPGKPFSFEVDLTGLCSFKELGTYKIIAKRQLTTGDNSRAFTVTSNPLSLTVVLGKWIEPPGYAPKGF